MNVLGVAGWSGSGKTTLIEGMLPRLTAAGLAVSTIKHAHHGLDMDQPGKDSYRHRAAGAREVIVASGTRWALLRETPHGEAALPDLLARLAPVDLVLVEGYKTEPHAKLEVHRPSLGKPPLWPGRDDIIAIASDATVASGGRPLLPLNDLEAVVAWVLQRQANPPGQVTGGRRAS